jgi:hypothetical protein
MASLNSKQRSSTDAAQMLRDVPAVPSYSSVAQSLNNINLVQARHERYGVLADCISPDRSTSEAVLVYRHLNPGRAPNRSTEDGKSPQTRAAARDTGYFGSVLPRPYESIVRLEHNDEIIDIRFLLKPYTQTRA